MSMIDAAQHFLAVTPMDDRWLFLGAAAVLLVSLGFWNWRGGVKAALVLLLFEGVVRKQLMPGLQDLNYAFKDLLLAGAYLRFFLAPDEAVRQSRLSIGRRTRWLMWLGVIGVSLSALHPNLGSPVAALFGLALYLFYFPLVVMMPHLYGSAAALKLGLLRYAWLALPICAVAMYQWYNPAPSYFSYYAAGVDVPPHVLGTFSCVTGFTAFLSLFFGLHLGLLGASPPVWARWMLSIHVALLIACGWCFGSRAAVLQMALWAVLLPGCLMLMSQVERTRVLGGLSLLVMLVSLCFFAFSKLEGRESNVFVTWKHVLRETTVLGNGIAITHSRMDSLRRLLDLPKPKVALAVSSEELPTVYSELGLAGFAAWCLLRITLMICAFRSVSAAGDFKVLYLAFALAQLISLFAPFVINPVAALLVIAAAGLTFRLEPKPALEASA